jgi:hypothetical protein
MNARKKKDLGVRSYSLLMLQVKLDPLVPTKLYFLPASSLCWCSVLKVSARYSNLLVAFCMVLVLDTVMTFTMVSVQVGWSSDFAMRFLRGWLVGFAVALPTSLLAMPLIRKLVKKLTSENR